MSHDNGTKELDRRAKIAQQSMNSAMWVGAVLSILSLIALFATKWLTS